MNKQLKSIAAALIFLAPMAMSSTASAADIITNQDGMTLYTFDKDVKGKSNCYGGCAAKWPPFIAGPAAEAKNGFGFITREDGSKQWTYKDQPLYTWIGDKKQGDTTGDGVGGVWHTAKKASRVYSSYSY